VVHDGFDELEKADAVRFYAGKTWSDVLAHLRSLRAEPLFRAAYFLEEWSVLAAPALSYYARAHLEYLWETLVDERPDEEFVFHLLGQLYQVFYMHKGSPFSPAQTDLLRRAALWIADETAGPDVFEYFADDITASAKRFLALPDHSGDVEAGGV
jgi:hypothetical protein